MATITITFPDDQNARVLDAFAVTFEYDRYVANGGTMTKAQFGKAQIITWMKGIVRAHEVRLRQQEIAATVPAVVDTDLT